MNNNKIKYFIYTRKSSEDEDRQIQSIDDQVKRLKELANDLGLDVKQIYTESKSAKKPNNRPLFDEMIDRIEKGEASGIICWQINRLTRNPIDSGKLAWLSQQGILQSIRTPEREFRPDDNVLMLSVESGVANQFILDLQKSTKRGMDSKLEKGWMPSLPPLGYLNNKEDKTIIIDPERFNLVRKMWDLMLTGAYTPRKILQIATNNWGFRTRKFKKIGGNEMSISGIYKLFTNTFYTGSFQFSGNIYQGKHQQMITLEEYDKVQIILGRKGKPRPQIHEFAFTGSIRCEECGCLYTAENKKKIAKKTGKVKEYCYYHCTRRTKKVACTQNKAIRKEVLELQIEQEIEKLTILPEFLHWALDCLSQNNDREIEDRSKIYEMLHSSLVATQSELDELTRMRYKQLIDDETFIKERKKLQTKITSLKDKLRETETRAEKWIELTEKTFKFATYARQAFIAGGLEKKKEILLALGCNPTIFNGVLKIKPNEWLAKIENEYPILETEYKRLELVGSGSLTGSTDIQKEALASIRTRWYPR